jgi:hypothetical protein
MRTKIVPVFALLAMLTALPGNALAGWMDNVPSRFIPQTHQTPIRTLGAVDVSSTTGSITGMPRRPSTHRPVRPGRDF